MATAPHTPGPVSDETLVRYVLGTLPQDESERLDERTIVDADFFDRVRGAEHDLADAYVRGELSADERLRWERTFLATKDGREQLRVAEALAARERSSPRSRHTSAWALGLAAAAALTLVTVTVLFVVRERRLDQPPVAGGAAPNAPVAIAPPPASRPPAAQSFVALTLAPATRSLIEPIALAIPAGTSEVRLTLRLDPNEFTRFKVEVRDRTSRRVVWQSAILQASAAGEGRALSLTVPATVFQPRRFAIEAAGLGARGVETVGTYQVNVVTQ